jgi:hypothetical protein
MNARFAHALAIIALCGLAASARAADKSGYTLFNPTPRDQMREMSTDRPDVTESPNTVDAGHFQAELSFIEWTHEEQGGLEADQINVLPMNLKVGLLNNVDLQLVLDPYVHVRVKVEGGGSARVDGFGDTQLRVKVNLWGNDGGDTALGLMPFIKFPTAGDDLGNDNVEGGLIVPFSITLPAEFELAAMVEFDILRDEADDDYGWGILHSVSLSRDLAENLGAFVEYIGFAPSDLGLGYQASVGAGLTYALSPDLQLDAAATIGISDSAEDFNLRIGLSFRI